MPPVCIPLPWLQVFALQKNMGVKCICEHRDIVPEGFIRKGTFKENSIIAKADVEYKEKYGGSIGAGASVLAAEASIKVEIYGFGIEIGISGDLLTAEANVSGGISKEPGKTKIWTDKDIGLGWGGVGLDWSLVLPF